MLLLVLACVSQAEQEEQFEAGEQHCEMCGFLVHHLEPLNSSEEMRDYLKLHACKAISGSHICGKQRNANSKLLKPAGVSLDEKQCRLHLRYRCDALVSKHLEEMIDAAHHEGASRCAGIVPKEVCTAARAKLLLGSGYGVEGDDVPKDTWNKGESLLVKRPFSQHLISVSCSLCTCAYSESWRSNCLPRPGAQAGSSGNANGMGPRWTKRAILTT